MSATSNHRRAWFAASLSLMIVSGAAAPVFAQRGPAAIITAKAELRELPSTMALVGTVDPARRSVIGAEVAALVIDMPVRQGDRVEQGDLLCHLNDSLFLRQLASAEAKLKGLEATLAELENGTRPEIVARLRADAQAAAAMAERWSFELERIKRLHGESVANEREYQDTVAEKLSADSRLASARAELDEAVAGPRAETIEAARCDVAEQAAEVARLNTQLSKTQIHAPFTGFVTMRHAELGSWLSAGDPVVELIDLETVLVVVDVPEAAIPFVKVGDTSRVTIDALHDSFEGKIRHIIPQADEAARTFPVEIELPNPDYRIKAGMFARATVTSGSATKQIVVPKDALIDSRGSMQVAMIVPGQDGGKMAIPNFVTLGSDSGDWVAITSGNIPPGAEVAIYGNEQLVYPQPVKVVSSRAEVDEPQPEPAAEASEKAESASQG